MIIVLSKYKAKEPCSFYTNRIHMRISYMHNPYTFCMIIVPEMC